jgi:hypothetical protein
MTRKRKSALITTAAAVVGVAASFTAPIASAVPLSNGLTVDCNPVGDGHQLACVVAGCARVNGNYVIDAVHIKPDGGEQIEREFKCINGETTTYTFQSFNLPFTDARVAANIAVQGCRKKDLKADWCGPWADYTYRGTEAPAEPPPKAVDPKPVDPKPVDPKPAEQKAADGTINASVELYDVPGGSGTVTGNLDTGDKVTFNGPCPMNNPNNPDDPTNGWCKITDTTKNLTGAVWGEFISK